MAPADPIPADSTLAIYIEHRDRLLTYAARIVRSRASAEDIVQEAWLRFSARARQGSEIAQPQGYLYRIVRNLALKKYHGNTAKKRNSVYDVALDEIADCIPSDASVEEEATAAEISRMIDAFLGTLCESDRIMFVRRYYHADSIEDLAEAFGKSRHYVSVRLSRIRSALKKHLSERGITL